MGGEEVATCEGEATFPLFSFLKILYICYLYPETEISVTGPEKEFYSFHGQCFEIKQNKLRTSHFNLYFISYFFSCVL